MATSVTLNGTSYSIPAVGEGSWGTSLSNYLIALSTGVLSKAGGAFTLTADTDFGANFGLKSIYYKSRGTTSTAGVLRLANAESVGWRNAANGANLQLLVNSSNLLEFDGVAIPTISSTSTLTNKTLDNTNTVTLKDTLFTLQDDGDTTKQLKFQLSGITTGTTRTLTVPDASDTLVGLTATQTLTNKTLTSPTIAGPTVSGTLLLQNSSGSQPELHLSEDPDNGTSVVKLKAPAALGGDITFTLPDNDGNANQVLQTNGSGVLSWASPFTNPMTTTGDIVYSSDGSGTPARLAIGASSTVLVGGATPSWAQIANAQVAAAAAIAGTKISPDFGAQTITTTGAISATGASGTLQVGSSVSQGAIGLGVAPNAGTAKLFVLQNSASVPVAFFRDTSGDTSTTLQALLRFGFDRTAAAANPGAKRFWEGIEDTGVTANITARVDLPGTFRSDSTYETSGADYAEFFEWEDGNTGGEDRAGCSVVLVGDNKIRIAQENEIPVGIVSARPSVVGNSPMAWPSKFLKDDFGRYLVVDGAKVVNPEYDENQEYVLREDRKEWATVGLLGRLRIKIGQPVNPNWIKLADISENVEEWLVR